MRPASLDVIPPEFYDRPAEQVARDLLGADIVSSVGQQRCVARIVETEAYVGPHDEASHAHERMGRTPRNSAMFGPPGTAYVYRIYGVHFCLNAVTCSEGYPAAVLVRAAQPLEGLNVMRARRPGRADRELLRGPGNLCRALQIDLTHNHTSLQVPPLLIQMGEPVPASEVVAGPRVGISRAVDATLRFAVAGSVWVSRSLPSG
ncbi:MAG TPA: DNA-3-methyladenine glycosylase [Longimicrobiaceae bacterium]|nr:DNA-3-methyladenine glycosylase [Longimicrobiaceae bacterium]